MMRRVAASARAPSPTWYLAATRQRFGTAATRHCATPMATAVGNTVALRLFSRSVTRLTSKTPDDAVHSFQQVQEQTGEQQEDERQEKEEEAASNNGNQDSYLPFPQPFHTINVISLLLLGNLAIYIATNSGSDETRDFLVEHFTLSHENAHRLYPFLTHAFYQEDFLQLAFDTWILTPFAMMPFVGGARLFALLVLCQIGGGILHVGRQCVQLYDGVDAVRVRARCFGANAFVCGLMCVECLIFRRLYVRSDGPPVPFIVFAAFIVVDDTLNVLTTMPEEHGAPHGGAIVGWFFWATKCRGFGLDKLTAKII